MLKKETLFIVWWRKWILVHESKLQTAQPVQLEGDCYKWNVKQRERKVVQQSFLLVASVGAVRRRFHSEQWLRRFGFCFWWRWTFWALFLSEQVREIFFDFTLMLTVWFLKQRSNKYTKKWIYEILNKKEAKYDINLHLQSKIKI